MIIGHKRQVKYLTKIARSGKVPHAFIFSGPDNIGKKLAAKMFFYLCLGKDKSQKDFFGDSRLSRSIREENHPDLLVVKPIEGKREMGIGQIRAIKKFVSLSPFELEKKFVLIDDAHKISREGINSFLKTLEEPSGDTVIVLVTSRQSLLPRTIHSRVVNISFYSLSEESLKEEIQKSGRKVMGGEFSWIAGRPGLAIRFFDNPEDENIKIIRESFLNFSKVIDQKSARQKISLAEKVAGEEQISLVLSSWLLAAREDLLGNFEKSSVERLKNIFRLRELLGVTNVNARLQLEDVLLES